MQSANPAQLGLVGLHDCPVGGDINTQGCEQACTCKSCCWLAGADHELQAAKQSMMCSGLALQGRITHLCIVGVHHGLAGWADGDGSLHFSLARPRDPCHLQRWQGSSSGRPVDLHCRRVQHTLQRLPHAPHLRQQQRHTGAPLSYSAHACTNTEPLVQQKPCALPVWHLLTPDF